MKKKLQKKFTLRMIWLTAVAMAIFATTSVFLAGSAAEDSASFGKPHITMTTAKAVGESLNLTVTGENIYVDYGDGHPVAYPGDGIVRGSDIKIYGFNITNLECPNNQLTSLAAITGLLNNLDCHSNRLTSLGLSDAFSCSESVSLDCSDNQLTYLETNDLTHFETFNCANNQLNWCEFKGCDYRTHVNCSNNNLPICFMDYLIKYDGEGSVRVLPSATYAPQTHVIPPTVPVGGDIDLAMEYYVYTDKAHFSEFVWYDSDGNEVTPATSKHGHFTFGHSAAGKTLVCKVTNSELPGFRIESDGTDNRLTTTPVTIVGDYYEDYTPTLDDLVITMTTSKALGENLPFDVAVDSSRNDVYIDWGDGKLVEFFEGGTLRDTTVRIYTDVLYDLGCNSCQITSLDLSKAKDLDGLYCQNNQLSSLDLSKNTEMRYLRCENNQLDFSVFNNIDIAKLTWFTYAPQAPYAIPSAVTVGDAIDLSSQYTVDGTVTEFIWYDGDGNVVLPATSNGGIFTFGTDAAGKSLVCKMTNAALPDFTVTANGTDNRLVTTPVKIVAEISYNVTPNINGGASKLYEPWGLRYYATFTGADTDKIVDRGIAILKDIYYTSGMTPAEFCANANANIFLSSRNELTFEAATAANPDGRYYATLTKGIYSYDIGAKYYVVPFAVMNNGQTIYGTIKSNSMENILKANLNLSTITNEEKAICTCIMDLKKSVAAHYEAAGVPGASVDMNIPRGSAQTAATVKTTAQTGITPNVVGGASRLIEPWGLRYFATYTDSADIAQRGMVILSEKYYQSSYSSSPDSMRLNANAYVFRDSDGTLLYQSETNRYYGTVTEGISSKDIADVYYVVPFVVLKDGSYVYGTVKSHSMMKIMNANLNSSSAPATEKAVSQDIIDLYNAVKAYYAAQ